MANASSSQTFEDENISVMQELREYNKIMRILEEDSSKYVSYFMMTKNEFNFIYNLIKTDIKLTVSKYRKAIGSKERLVICLRFLVMGHPIHNICYQFGLTYITVRSIVEEICLSIWEALSPMVMPRLTVQNWLDIADRYEKVWKFPNCIGTIAGKCIKIERPISISSAYYKDDGDNTIVVMAIIDADLKIVAIDVGAYDQNDEDSIFYRSNIGLILEEDICIPRMHKPLIVNEYSIPYVLIGDRTFPLKDYMLRPYYPALTISEDIFNVRLMHARQMVVANVFDMLFARWKIFRKPIMLEPEFMKIIILATCALHNFISVPVVLHSQPNGESSFVDFKPLIENVNENASLIRKIFADYFNSPSENWQ